ncbi:hypothetical protein [Nocardia sp. CA-290969]|uniref:hypothetical protein n=1 Tax=Nocardia sp. CA-290969 TaxID=3239986 RepID=UPI003D93CFE4
MGLGDWLGDHIDDIAIGVASAAGFALGGPAGAALLGGAAGGISAWVQGENVLEGAAFAAAGGMLGGALGIAGKGMISAFGQTALQGGKGLVTNGVVRAVPSGFQGVRGALNDSTFRMGMGMLSAGAMAGPWSTDNMLREPYYNQLAGYPEVPLIDISSAELSDIPDGMPDVMMPDPGNLPYGLEFNPPMQQNYRTIPGTYLGTRKSFGDEPGKTGLPEELSVSEISGEEAAGIPSYTERVAALREHYAELRSLSGTVAQAVERTEDLCKGGRTDIDASIEALAKFAGVHPRDVEKITGFAEEYAEKVSPRTKTPVFLVDPAQLAAGMTEDIYAMTLVESVSLSVEAILTGYNTLFEALAEEATPDEPVVPELPDSEDKETEEKPADSDDDPAGDDDTAGGNDDPQFEPGATEQTPESGADDPAGAGTVAAPEPLDLSAETEGSENASPTGAGEGAEGADPAVSGMDSTGTDTVAAPQQPVTPSAAGLGSGFGMEAMMLPQLMQAMMNRGNQGDRGERDDSSPDRDRPDAVPPVTAVPSGPVAAPGGGQPATGGQPAGPAPGQVPAKAVSPPADTGRPPVPARPVDPAAKVVYTFPDGRSQEVSGVVARVLDAALGNAAGTDARAAYAGTAAEWTDRKQIGTRIDPGQVMTGDVAVWEGRTAILVRFGEAGDGTVEAVVDGALQVVTELAGMRDGEGEFGPFTGFFHPPGIEIAGAAAAQAAPASTDESAAGAVVPA